LHCETGVERAVRLGLSVAVAWKKWREMVSLLTISIGNAFSSVGIYASTVLAEYTGLI